MNQNGSASFKEARPNLSLQSSEMSKDQDVQRHGIDIIDSYNIELAHPTTSINPAGFSLTPRLQDVKEKHNKIGKASKECNNLDLKTPERETRKERCFVPLRPAKPRSCRAKILGEKSRRKLAMGRVPIPPLKKMKSSSSVSLSRREENIPLYGKRSEKLNGDTSLKLRRDLRLSDTSIKNKAPGPSNRVHEASLGHNSVAAPKLEIKCHSLPIVLTPSPTNNLDIGTMKSFKERKDSAGKNSLFGSLSGVSILSASLDRNDNQCSANSPVMNYLFIKSEEMAEFITSTPVEENVKKNWEEISSLSDGESDSSSLYEMRKESRFIFSSDIPFSDPSQDECGSPNAGSWINLSGSDKENIDPISKKRTMKLRSTGQETIDNSLSNRTTSSGKVDNEANPEHRSQSPVLLMPAGEKILVKSGLDCYESSEGTVTSITDIGSESQVLSSLSPVF